MDTNCSDQVKRVALWIVHGWMVEAGTAGPQTPAELGQALELPEGCDFDTTDFGEEHLICDGQRLVEFLVYFGTQRKEDGNFLYASSRPKRARRRHEGWLTWRRRQTTASKTWKAKENRFTTRLISIIDATGAFQLGDWSGWLAMRSSTNILLRRLAGHGSITGQMRPPSPEPLCLVADKSMTITKAVVQRLVDDRFSSDEGDGAGVAFWNIGVLGTWGSKEKAMSRGCH